MMRRPRETLGTLLLLTTRCVLSIGTLSQTTVRSPPLRPRAAAFRKWCDSVGISAPNLEHTRSASGLPGVTVRPTANLVPGECVITVPAHAALVSFADDPTPEEEGTPGTSRCREVESPVPHLLIDEAWRTTRQDYRLALLLIDERRKGPSSRLVGYVNHLPPLSGPGRERIDTLARWNDAELALLRSPNLVGASLDRERTNSKWFDTQQLGDLGGGGGTSVANGNGRGDAVTREEFNWALDVVQTRAFSGNFSGRRGGTWDCALLPFIDDLNHGGGSSSSSISSEGDDSKGASSPTPMAGKVMRHDPENDWFTWVTREAYSGGDEVSHGYLRGVNEEFLLTWGFAPDNNEDDVSRIVVEGVSCNVGPDGTIAEEERVVGELLDSGVATTDEVWRCIANACDAEALTLESEGESVEGPVAEHRRLIADSFVEGRQKLLRTGCDHALQRASEFSD